jgi:hypothetical protein
MILYAVLLLVSTLLWAALGFVGLGKRSGVIAPVTSGLDAGDRKRLRLGPDSRIAR